MSFSPSYETESSPCWMAMLYGDIESECRGHFRASADIPSSASFYRDELDRALSEQSFGLIGHEITGQCSAQEATAAVTLLEGTRIRVRLDIRGYQIDGGETYETIEGLLESTSEMYVQKRRDELNTRLQDLAV